MTKEKDFQEQVRDAQREMNTWPASRKEAVKLEGQANYDRVVRDSSATSLNSNHHSSKNTE